MTGRGPGGATTTIVRRHARPARTRGAGWTNMPDLDTIALVLALVATVGMVAIGLLLLRLDRARRADAERLARLEQRLELLRQSSGALIAGANGVDRRLRELKERLRALSERQENYELQQVDEQPYGQAIRLVRQGAGAGRLVDELDLSESEADLIVRLHGQRDAG
jgi:hypothetical protein